MLILKKKIIRKNKLNIKKLLKKNMIVNFNIFSTFNNTIITLTNSLGGTISWITSASIGFKGGKKSMHYASQIASEQLGKKSIKLGYYYTNIYIKGIGLGRDFAIKGIFNSGLKILTVNDITPVPHNGCKPKKIRRR